MSWKLRERAQRLLDQETGTVRKGFGGKTAVALIYPNTYHVGMSNLGFLAMYHYLNRHPHILCERAFLPEEEDLREFERTRTPLFSLESGEPLSSFHFLAFSISYENDYLNVLKILEMAQVPLLAAERSSSDPLVVMGGACALSNPEPLADFVDLCFLGEGEDAFPSILESFLALEKKPEPRETFLREAAGREGIYIPRYYRFHFRPDGAIAEIEVTPPAPARVRKHTVSHLDEYPIWSFVKTPHTEFGGMHLLEITRGCRRGCRFCLAGSVYRPFRSRRREAILQSLPEGGSPLQRIGLVGACISDHPEIEGLCRDLTTGGFAISASSLRAGAIPNGLLSSIAESGQRTVTLAPEAASDRLRQLIGKDMRETELMDSVDEILKLGIPNLKLYFMVGLPTEEEEEVRAIAEMAKRVKHLMLVRARDSRRLGEVTLSVNAFVPKPWTAFQWLPLEEVPLLQQKLSTVGRALKGVSHITFFQGLPRWAYVQALLAKGDRRVGGLLLSVHRLGGQWKRAFREWTLNPDFFVYRPRPLDEVLPWDHLEVGVSKEHLLDEFRKAGFP